MKFFTTKEIREKPIQELFAHLKEIEGAKKRFPVSFKEVEDDFFAGDELTTEELAREGYLKFDHDEELYQFPSGDERKRFEKKSFLGFETMPTKGFFWKLRTEITELPFAFIKVQFQIIKVGLASDLKYLGDQVVFRDNKEMYYDFDNQKFVHVANLKKDSPEKDALILRKKLYTEVRIRLEKENHVYREKLSAAYKDLYHHTYLTNGRLDDLKMFFEKFIKHMNQLKPYFPIKRFFSQITKEHDERLTSYIARIEENAPKIIKLLEKYEGEGKKNLIDLYDFENEHKNVNVIGLYRNQIVWLFRYNDNSPHSKALDGYFAFNENRLYENLVLIEIEASRSVHSETRSTRENKKIDLLERVKSGKEKFHDKIF